MIGRGARERVARARARAASRHGWLVACAVGAGVAAASAAALDRVAPVSADAPHRASAVECRSCHGDGDRGAPPDSLCTSCHGAQAHRPRAAHGAASRAGELACRSCHVVHGGRGLSLAPSGAATYWDGASIADGGAHRALGLAAHVPLVALSRCSPCHDPSRGDDPVARCVAPGVDQSVCFDEHVAARGQSDALPAPTRARERARAVAHQVARELTVSAPPPSAPTPPRANLAGALVPAALGAAAWIWRRRRRASKPAGQPAGSPPPRGRRLPVVRASTCLGCSACVDACPVDVLAVVAYRAEVVRPEACCGLALCLDACPNGSLSLTEGASADDIPPVGANFESTLVPGVFLAGEITGVPLIKNAINQGARAMEEAHRSLACGGPEGLIDVLVVGAGPAGLSAALRGRELGLRVVVLEQSSLAATVLSFPRGKIVHDPPLALPLEGSLWLAEGTREELLAAWRRLARLHRLDIREHERVDGLEARDRSFLVRTSRGQLEARRVLVATGRRGTPRESGIEVAADAVSRVAHALTDAAAYRGEHVLIVGLGDSAMEAAIALERQPGTRVTLVHRGSGFDRGQARNRQQVRALVAGGRIDLRTRTRVRSVERAKATLESLDSGEISELAVDRVLTLLGGGSPADLLRALGLLGNVGPLVGDAEIDRARGA